MLKEVPPSGSGTKRKKVYYLNEYLHFIYPITTSKPQTGNISITEALNEETENEGEEMPVLSSASLPST